MTERSPEVWAIADLTPISPAPLHISSPVVVPALQDQADTLSIMSHSNNGQLPAGAAEIPGQATSTSAMGRADAASQNGIRTASIQDEIHSADGASLYGDEDGASLYGDGDGASLYGNDDGAESREEGATLVKNEEEANQHSGLQNMNGVAEAQQDVFNTKESITSSDASESLTNHAEVTAPSLDISLTTPTQSVSQALPSPSAAQGLPEPQELRELRRQQEPQEQAVVASSAGSADEPQLPSAASAENSDHAASTANDEIDIQSLVDKIIGNASAGNVNATSASQNSASLAVSDAVSLPPRPPLTQQTAAQSHVRPEDALNYQPALSYPNAITVSSNVPPPPGTYSAGAPGTTSSDPRSSLPPPPASSVTSLPNHSIPLAHFDPAYAAGAPSPAHAAPQLQSFDHPQRWETFLQEERRYVSEAKWDRFPDGSRLFIGNLSSDRVSKKEVFDIFSPYGSLAQISLKQAYGFVQYHSFAEGQAAMDHLQGMEVRGRKVDLEFSRMQKRDGDGEKRGNRGKRDGERHDGRRARRDDYRSGRQSSPQRGSHRQQPSYDTGRGQYDDHSSRGRSRSPGHGKRDLGHYRHRSTSPYRRHPSEVDLDIPRRHGGEVPDVQFLLLQEVEREFVSWVEHAFVSQGLKVHVMFLHPRFPREVVIQRQVREGVHALIELDYRAQQSGTISLQVFDRSNGLGNVRYDEYQNLDPNVAAQLVIRAKAQVSPQPSYGAHYPPVHYHQPAYHRPAHHQPAQPQPPYSLSSYPPQPYPGASAPAPAPATAGNAGGPLHNATLQKIFGSFQGQGHSPGQVGRDAQPDMNSLIANFGGANAANAAGLSLQPNVAYSSGRTNDAPNTPSSDPAQHVHNIMAQLARYRQ
ncbi:hypothetical protein F4677DRAFT_341565 [Hypoxylon crocopeplum]|nr:hypothetical protein F4677DRAFT_341565 [Hypoxylon crocopeplum]